MVFKESITSLEGLIAQVKQQSHFHRLVDSLPFIYYICGLCPDAEIYHLSQGCSLLLGYTSEELIGEKAILSYNQLIHPEDLPQVLATIVAAAQTEQAYEVEYRVLTKAGTQKWVWEQGICVRTIAGEVLGFEGFICDITELKQTSLRLQNLVANVPGAVYQYVRTTDGGVKCPYISTSCQEIFGLEAEAIQDQPNLLLELVHPEDHPNLETSILQSAQEMKPWQWEGRFILPSGEIKWIQGASCPTHQASGEILWDGLLLDVTQFRHAQEQLHFQAGVLAQVKDAVIAIDLERRVIYWNAAAERLYQVPAAEILGCPLTTAYEEQWLSLAEQQQAAQVLAQRGCWQGENIHLKGNGEEIYVESSVNLLKDSQGRAIGSLAVIRDISDRKKAENALRETHQELQAIFEALPDLYFCLSADGVYLDYHTADPRELYPSPVHFLNRSVQEVLPAPVGEQFQQAIGQALQTGAVVSFEYALPILTQVQIYEARLVRFTSDQVIALVRNISDRKQTEAALQEANQSLLQANNALRESEERYALAIQGANDGIWDWDLRTNQIYFSGRWKSILGYGTSEIGNQLQEWFDRIHPLERAEVAAEIQAHLAGAIPQFEREHRMSCKNGAYRWVLSRGIAVRDRQGRPYRMAGSLTDVNEYHLARQQLMHDALHDPLTRLPNRSLFMDKLGQAIRHMKRQLDYQFAVLFFDLDRFKVVNDSLGHLAGDKLLIKIAQRLEKSLRPEDTLARLGGDEFGILIECSESAPLMARRILKALHKPFYIEGHEIFTNGSIGIAVSHQALICPEGYLRNADIAMYHAKKAGGDRYQIFTEDMHACAVARLHLENDLRRALERGEFQLYYQPIVSLCTGETIAFEALLRWQHPVCGLMPPEDFIEVAEETGLIVPIGTWVLREACQQMAQWQQSATTVPSVCISVNLSSKQIGHPELVAQIDQILAETGLPHHCLRLEITESMVIENADVARQTLLQLKARQIQLSMDDFGTGYSSLSYLHRFPIDWLKIDRSFVNQMLEVKENMEIIRAIVAIAQSLEMGVVAEGIETEAQAIRLQQLGCQYAQGYFYARPAPANQIQAQFPSRPACIS